MESSLRVGNSDYFLWFYRWEPVSLCHHRMKASYRIMVIILAGGTLLRVLFFTSLFALFAGAMLPVVLESIPYVEELRDQKRAEATLYQAARWYVINNGAPNHTLNSEEVKQILIPDYLNKWPGKDPIECIIKPDGTVTVYTREQE